MRGAIVELGDAAERRRALALAALARALRGDPVHLASASEAAAAATAAQLAAPLGALRLPQDAVRCATLREVAFDYLRDRLQLGSRPRRLRGVVERLAGDAPAAGRLRLSGLHCALVDDADLAMIDDLMAPLVMTAEADAAGAELVREQADELARALAPGADFAAGEDGVRLTAEGARRLAQLSMLLGAVWSVRARREELVCAALAALHLGRKPQHKPDVIYRMTVARFLNRYHHLAGACADARGIEDDFWTLYALRTQRAGEPPARSLPSVRLFRDSAAKRAAVRAAAAGAPSLVAVRTNEEAQAFAGLPLTVHPAQRGAAPAQGRAPRLLVAELHDSARHLPQIARAYGAAETEVLLALEDTAVKAALGPGLCAALAKAGGEALPPALARWAARRAQLGAEAAQSRIRRDLVARERQFDELLAFSGGS